MATYLISLEQRTKCDFSDLDKKIRNLSEIAPVNPVKYVWILHSIQNSEEIRDALLAHIHAKDSLFVIRIHADDWASWNVHKNTEVWLNKDVI